MDKKEKEKRTRPYSVTNNYAKLIAEKDREEKEQKSRGVLLSFIGFAVLLLIIYAVHFPMTIYEKAEESVRNASSLDEVDDSIVTTDGALTEKHQEEIVLTQEMYSTRRDEIISEIKNGPITSMAISICEDMIAEGDYGPTAQFRSFEWIIPEEDMTLSAEEADELLYLYSCMYDYDFFNGSSRTFRDWFYGYDDSTMLYEVEAYGNIYNLAGHSGCFLTPAVYAEAREASIAAGEAAVAAEKAEALSQYINSPILAKIAVFLLKPFMITAEASDGDTYYNAYQAKMDEYISTYGACVADSIIYTGVSDQINGTISFAFESEPAELWADCEFNEGSDKMWYNTIEKYREDKTAQGIVQDYNAMPFKGRLIVHTEEETKQLPSIYDYYTSYYLYTEPYGGDIWSLGDPWAYVGQYIEGYWICCGSYQRLKSIENRVEHTTYVSIFAYNCIEFVDFVGKCNVNASNMVNVVQRFLDTALDEVANTDYSKYNGHQGAWCADFVTWCAEQIGLAEEGVTDGTWDEFKAREDLMFIDAAGCASWHGALKMKGYEENNVADCSQFNNGSGDSMKEGDIVLWRRGGEWSHIGIVSEVTDASVTIVQGNAGGGEGIVTATTYFKAQDGCGLQDGVYFHPDYPDYESILTF